jgi:hypothetical protein
VQSILVATFSTVSGSNSANDLRAIQSEIYTQIQNNFNANFDLNFPGSDADITVGRDNNVLRVTFLGAGFEAVLTQTTASGPSAATSLLSIIKGSTELHGVSVGSVDAATLVLDGLYVPHVVTPTEPATAPTSRQSSTQLSTQSTTVIADETMEATVGGGPGPATASTNDDDGHFWSDTDILIYIIVGGVALLALIALGTRRYCAGHIETFSPNDEFNSAGGYTVTSDRYAETIDVTSEIGGLSDSGYSVTPEYQSPRNVDTYATPQNKSSMSLQETSFMSLDTVSETDPGRMA